MDNKKVNKLKIFFIIILSVILVTFAVLGYLKNNTNRLKKEDPKGLPEENLIINNTINESINEINNETNKERSTNENQTSTKENTVKSETIIKDTLNNKFDSSVAFIGDSRTQGFLMYNGLNDVVDYTYIGLMVNKAISKEFVKSSDGKKITILQDMATKDIDTVYIMLGINELGWKYSQVFVKYYASLIDKIKEVKPNCKIYIQSIIPVTEEKSKTDNTYNNNNIKKYNKLIKKLAQDKNITYLDVASYLSDSSGNLPSSASSDGIHINKEYCLRWYEYLKNN